MTLGNKIAELRKLNNLTQDALAQELGVSNQAVSKWESDQCCPDISLLPKLADLFGISIDALFDREPAVSAAPKTELPWPDDDTLHAVLFVGHKLVGDGKAAKDITFTYEGPALNVDSAFGVCCSDVAGNVMAGGYVNCSDVGGHVSAGGYVNCGDVGGSVSAMGNLNCGDIGKDAQAGGDVECGDVGSSVTAGGDVDCGDVGMGLRAGGDVDCSDVGGNVTAGGDVNCDEVGGIVNADGELNCDGTKVRITMHTDRPKDEASDDGDKTAEMAQKIAEEVQSKAQKITEDTMSYLSKVMEKMRSQWGDNKKNPEDPNPPAES